MLRLRPSEIPRLVQRLGSRRPACVDAARARLSVIGARAVDELVSALEGAENRARARVMPLLALIQDPRGRAPLTAMLLDRSPRLRAIAAQSLGRFVSADTVAALKQTLKRERNGRVREAIVRGLVEQFAAGQEQALACLLEILGSGRENLGMRLAAFAVLPLLPAAERRAVLGRLRRDPESDVRRRAEALASLGAPGTETPAEEVARLIGRLASEDFAVWNQVVRQLGECGSPAIRPLVAEMQRRAHDPEYCTRAGMALKAMGPRRGRALADAMDSIDEPLPLHVLVDVIGALGEKSLIYRLKDLIDRLAQQRYPSGTSDLGQRVRAKAHLELARIGSRVAIQDLREALSDPDRRIEVEVLSALRRIGKRDEIAVLLRAYTREDEPIRKEIAEVVRTIMRRERIRRNHRMFQALRSDQRSALGEILPPRPRPTQGRAPRRTRAVLAQHDPP